MNEEHEKFGSSCGNSRWFNASPKIKESRMIPVQQIWPCPIDGCKGEMEYNGSMWATCEAGYHHTCSKCNFTAAIKGARYPRIVYVPDESNA